MAIERVALVPIALVLFGCALVPASAPNSDSPTRSPAQSNAQKRISIAARGNLTTLSEAVNTAGAGGTPGLAEVSQLLHAGLAAFDGNGNLQPKLALEIPSIENGRWTLLPDGRMRMRWRVRPGVTWHDGTPFTTDDLIFTAKLAQDKGPGLAPGGMFDSIEGLDPIDPLTLQVSWKKPHIRADMLFVSSLHSRVLPMPKHLVERPYDDDKTTVAQLPLWSREFVGLGPYRLRELVDGSHLVAEAYERYVLGRPRIDEIEVRFMPDPSTISANLLAGSVDIAFRRSLSLEQGLGLRDQWQSGRMETPLEGDSVALFPQLINPTPAVLADARFRQGLLLALDRQEMAETIQAGLTPVAHSLIGPDEPEYRDIEVSIVRYDYDPRRAAQLIELFGYARDLGDGVYRDATNQRLTVELRTRRGSDIQEKTLFGAAGYWSRLGIGVDPFTFPAQRADDREYRANRPAFEVVVQLGGLDALTNYHGANAPLPENGYRGGNRSRCRNSEFDALLDRLFVTIDPDERVAVLRRVVAQMTSDVIPLLVYYNLFPAMISNRLTNISPRNPAWNAHEWDLK